MVTHEQRLNLELNKVRAKCEVTPMKNVYGM